MDRSLIKKNFWHLFQPAISGKIVYIVVYLVFIVYPAISQATVCRDLFLRVKIIGAKITTWRLERQNKLPKKIEGLIIQYSSMEKLRKKYLRRKESIKAIQDKQGDNEIINTEEIDEELVELRREMREVSALLGKFYKRTHKYIFVGHYSEGRATVHDKAGYSFHIDIYGKRVYSESYHSVTPYAHGRAGVIDLEGNELFIDLNGERIDYED